MSNTERTILDVLTMDEIEQLEKLTGSSVNTLFGKGEFPGRALKFLVWLLQLRTDKNAKIEEVGKMTLFKALDTRIVERKEPVRTGARPRASRATISPASLPANLISLASTPIACRALIELRRPLTLMPEVFDILSRQ